jgi:mannose-1-phosphate guanylyltransferase/phosphomannomutase
MRHMVESFRQYPLDLTDGVKVMYSDNHWILVLPSAGEPLVHIIANGTDSVRHSGQRWAEEKLQEFCHHIDTFCKIQSALVQDTALLSDA